MNVLSDVAEAYAGALVNLLEQAAWWRNQKAEEWPEDGRNARAAKALTSAAQYVSEIASPIENHGLRLFAELDAELDEFGRSLDPSEIVVSSSTQAARFFFDNGSDEPTARHFDALIVRVFHETLESWRETLEQEDAMQPPRSLVTFFNDHGVPLWDDQEDDV